MFAGRTDAGVHARGQVAAFNTSSDLEISVFETGLNAWLPKDIAVRSAHEADANFDPRRQAIHRTYRYTIYNAPSRSPLTRGRAWQVPASLDIEAMREAASALVGEHDFASFTRDEGVSTVRCVLGCNIVHAPPTVAVEITANAFLRHQVRRTVGALVAVGSGKLSLEAFRNLIARPELATAGPVAPPHGLCLEEVAYQGLDLTNRNAL